MRGRERKGWRGLDNKRLVAAKRGVTTRRRGLVVAAGDMRKWEIRVLLVRLGAARDGRRDRSKRCRLRSRDSYRRPLGSGISTGW